VGNANRAFTYAGTPSNFSNFTPLAASVASGRLDQPGGLDDIWFATDADRDGVADSLS
jgi:hypothetical protein